ncbi:MAG: hypothetical protein OEM59_12580 [Rhodospirillales bacterium]|nr:hypothetical protein [Rhodospirillales bacterium]
MSLPETIAAMALAAFVFALANYRSRQPYEAGKLFQVPYLGIQFAAVLAIVLLLGYLSSLLRP